MSPRWAPAHAGAGPSVVDSIFSTPSSGCSVATSARIVLVTLAALQGNSAAFTVIAEAAEPDDEPDEPDEPDDPLPQAVRAAPTVSSAQSATPVRCRRSNRPSIIESF